MVRTAKNTLKVLILTQSCACEPFYKNGKSSSTLHHSVLANILTKFVIKFWGKMQYNIKLQLSQHFIFDITIFHSANKINI